MFKCQQTGCGKQVPSRQPVNRIVLESRHKTYERPVRRGRRFVGTELVEGWEIVKEISVCPKCYRSSTGKTPKLQLPEPKKFEKKPFKRFEDRRPRKKWRNPQQNKDNHPQGSSKKAPIVEKIQTIKK